MREATRPSFRDGGPESWPQAAVARGGLPLPIPRHDQPDGARLRFREGLLGQRRQLQRVRVPRVRQVLPGARQAHAGLHARAAGGPPRLHEPGGRPHPLPPRRLRGRRLVPQGHPGHAQPVVHRRERLDARHQAGVRARRGRLGLHARADRPQQHQKHRLCQRRRPVARARPAAARLFPAARQLQARQVAARHRVWRAGAQGLVAAQLQGAGAPARPPPPRRTRHKCAVPRAARKRCCARCAVASLRAHRTARGTRGSARAGGHAWAGTHELARAASPRPDARCPTLAGRAAWRQVSPHELLQAIMHASGNRFKIGTQTDPMDFLAWLLNALHTALGGTKKAGSSIIHKTFQGTVKISTHKADDEAPVTRPAAARNGAEPKRDHRRRTQRSSAQAQSPPAAEPKRRAPPPRRRRAQA
eukprot:5378455-Prymnesium_polylepis.1